jgi:hypothetical protein
LPKITRNGERTGEAVPIKKEKKTEFTAPVLDLRMAQLQIIEGTLQEEPLEVTTKSGETFTSKPNYDAKIEVVDDFQDGTYDGIQFYDRFVLKQNQDGEWIIKGGTKLGYLCEARYGDKFFEDDNDQEFDEEDFIGFTFQAALEPKKNRTTNQVTGTSVAYQTIHAVPSPKKKSKTTKKDTTVKKNSGPIQDELDLTPEELA